MICAPPKMVGDDVRSLHSAGEKLETPHVVTYPNTSHSVVGQASRLSGEHAR